MYPKHRDIYSVKPFVIPLAYVPGERARKGYANPPAFGLRAGALFIPIPGTLLSPSATFRRLAMCYLFPIRAGGRFLPGRCEGKKPTPRQPSVGLYKGGGLGSGRFSLLSPGLSYRGVYQFQGVYYVYTAV